MPTVIHQLADAFLKRKQAMSEGKRAKSVLPGSDYFMPKSAKQDLANRLSVFEQGGLPELFGIDKEAIGKTAEQGVSLAKSVARGVPQMATGLVDLAAMPFEAAGVLQPGQAVGSTKWLESRGYLPESQPGFANQLTELLSGGFDPSDLITKGAPMLAALRTTWHGSPHGFTKFDMSKIGTGEGAQAYGHGLYLAEAQDVAQQYQKDLTKGGDLIGGKPINQLYEKIQRQADRLPPQQAELEYEKLGFLEDLMQQSDAGAALKRLDNEDLLPWAEEIAKKWQPGGYLYKVELPDEQIAKMLDWDKPLSQQAPEVQQAFRNTDFYKQAQDYYGQNPKQWYLDPEQKTGESLYQYMQGGIGDEVGGGMTPAQASAYLQQAGIPGIQYLDQASRGAGEGTRNYVVFSDEIPKILERNGTSVFEFPKEQITQSLESVNPTGTVFTEYNPSPRATMPLGKNITTLDKTMEVSPSEYVTVYRGVPSGVKDISPGDFITTNQQLAKDYAGNGKVISKRVPASHILDDITEPLGEEYIYRP